MGAVVTSSRVVCAPLSSSAEGLSTLFPCSSVGSLPWKAVPHEHFQCGSFPQAAVLQQLLQGGSLSRQCSPSGTGSSTVGPLQCHRSCQQARYSRSSSLHGPTGAAMSLLQRGLPTGSQHPLNIHLLWCGALHGLQVDLFPFGTPQPAGGQLPHHGLCQALWENLCSP